VIKQPIKGQAITEDGVLTERAYQMMRLLVQLDILEGSGSPEGVIAAQPRRLYMNTAGTAGSILYIKRDADVAGDTSQGWILV